MCGPHESKQIAAMLFFSKLVVYFFVESSELPTGKKTGKASFYYKCQTLEMFSNEKFNLILYPLDTYDF